MDPVPPTPPVTPPVETPPPPPVSTDFHNPPPPPPSTAPLYAVHVPHRGPSIIKILLISIPLIGLAALGAYLIGLGNGVSLTRSTQKVVTLAATPTATPPIATSTPLPEPENPNGFLKIEQLKFPVMPQFTYSPNENITSYLTSPRLSGSFQVDVTAFSDTNLVSARVGLSTAVIDADSCKTFSLNKQIQSLPAEQKLGEQTWAAGQINSSTTTTQTTTRMYHLYYKNTCYEQVQEVILAKQGTPVDEATLWALLDQIAIHTKQI